MEDQISLRKNIEQKYFIEYIFINWIKINLYIYIYIYIHLPIYLSIYLSIYLTIYLSIYLSVYLSIYLSDFWMTGCDCRIAAFNCTQQCQYNMFFCLWLFCVGNNAFVHYILNPTINGYCRIENVVCKYVFFTRKMSKEHVYIGVAEDDWKQHYYNHTIKFRNEKHKNDAVLSICFYCGIRS